MPSREGRQGIKSCIRAKCVLRCSMDLKHLVTWCLFQNHYSTQHELHVETVESHPQPVHSRSAFEVGTIASAFRGIISKLKNVSRALELTLRGFYGKIRKTSGPRGLAFPAKSRHRSSQHLVDNLVRHLWVKDLTCIWGGWKGSFQFNFIAESADPMVMFQLLKKSMLRKE